MKLKLSLIGVATLVLAACDMASQEDQLENSIRNSLESQGNVQQVEMTKQDEENFTGFAVIRDRNGREGRLNCTARRTEGTNYDWRCLPTITEPVVAEMEALIRTELERQATVLEVDMTRQDDNNMTGFARVQDAAGNEIRTTCVAARSPVGTSNFSWRCRPDDGTQPAGQEAPTSEEAPAGGGDKPS
jgi:hypothetical protein